MAEVLSIAAGFVLTTIVGGWWASRLQQRSWQRQNDIRVKEEETRRAGEVCDELTRLLDKRLYRMFRLYWAIEALRRGDGTREYFDARLADYNDVLYEWNDRFNANLALIGTHFGEDARGYLFDLYGAFTQAGLEFNLCTRAVREGADPSDALAVIGPKVVGWSADSLNTRVYTLGLAMTTQLRDGDVGRRVHDHLSRPTLTVSSRATETFAALPDLP